MNRDEGSYQLSHAYDRFLDTASSVVYSIIIIIIIGQTFCFWNILAC